MTLTDTYRADLLSLVEHYKAISDKADSAVSLGAFPGDHDFVTRLRKGQNFTIYKAERLERYIEERLNDIRDQLAVRGRGHQGSEEANQARKAAREHPPSGGPEAGRPFAEDDRTEDRYRGIPSPYRV